MNGEPLHFSTEIAVFLDEDSEVPYGVLRSGEDGYEFVVDEAQVFDADELRQIASKIDRLNADAGIEVGERTHAQSQTHDESR